MYTIKFCFESGDPVIIDANPGEKLLDVARKANVAIDAPCSGNGVCGKCRVRLASGTLNAPINRHITSEEYKAGWRLACLAVVTGDAEIEVPDIASAYRSRMKMADLSSPEEIAIFENLKSQLEQAGITFGSDLSFLPLELSEPTLEDTMPDNERLLRAVEAATGVDESAIMLPYSVLKDLAWVLRESEFKVKCVISRDQNRILIRDVLPQSNTDPMVGFALDLGTTSLAGVLVDLETGKILAKASGGNGQIRYGADVINRIIESDKVGGR
ncbi:MAG: 2Fe-2S iron-sulfur cluster binding domain-containing protein, partial [Oscillospiraceae bacterium]|nr:2Fe-2S iron-sulfur cluster binding domain-containing protein [Oscillospiraceae bacterium]